MTDHITVALTPDQVADQERGPTTPTGKRRAAHVNAGVVMVSISDIIAIEHEAAAAERERLRAEVESQRTFSDPDIWDKFVAILADPEAPSDD